MLSSDFGANNSPDIQEKLIGMYNAINKISLHESKETVSRQKHGKNIKLGRQINLVRKYSLKFNEKSPFSCHRKYSCARQQIP